MGVVGRVESLRRYPVKSMRGEELRQAFLGFAGIYGDRIYAFGNSTASKGFPYLTGRELSEMLLYQPRFRHLDLAKAPPNLAEAEALGPGVTPVYPSPAGMMVDVETPSGVIFAIDDPALITLLKDRATGVGTVTLMRSDRALTDCRPISFLSTQTVRQLGEEVGTELDGRRFRANIYANLDPSAGFSEDAFVGRTIRIGAKAVIAVTGRDPRCKMITIDPVTSQANADVLRMVARRHEGMAGIYGAVQVEGMVEPGDEITLLD
jgi:hypothetical protein